MPKELKIVCLGDSITWGYPLGHKNSWVYMLQQSINAEIVNAGISGDTTSQMLRRFNRDVLSEKPDYVVIMGGANDIVCAESHDRIKWNFKQMLDLAFENNIKVIIGLPTPLVETYYEIGLSKIRDWLIETCAEFKLPYINFAAAFYDSSGILRQDLILPDGGHPESEGYRQMFYQIDLSIFK